MTDRQWVSAGHDRPANAAQAFNVTRFFCLVVLLLVAAGCSRLDSRGKLSTNPDKLAKQVVSAMGGKSALAKTRYLRFDFISTENGKLRERRSHLWDRKTGRYRLELQLPEGFQVILFNVNSGQGTAFLDSRPLPQAAQKQALENALAWHRSDSDWPLGIFNIIDKRATRLYQGETEIEGKSYPTLTAMLPEGRMGLFNIFSIDPETHRPVQSSSGTSTIHSTYAWTEWSPAGNLTLPIRFKSTRSNREIRIESLYIPSEVDDRLFNDPFTMTKK